MCKMLKLVECTVKQMKIWALWAYRNCIFKLSITFREYFKVRNEIHHRYTRNNKKLNIPKAKTNYGSNSIKVVGAKIYNQIPEDLQNVETEKKLKKHVKMYLLSEY